MLLPLPRALARLALISLAILPSAAPVRADGPVTVSRPMCRGPICYVLVSDQAGSGVLVRARGLHRARTLALETRSALLSGELVPEPSACAPVPELCPAG